MLQQTTTTTSLLTSFQLLLLLPEKVLTAGVRACVCIHVSVFVCACSRSLSLSVYVSVSRSQFMRSVPWAPTCCLVRAFEAAVFKLFYFARLLLAACVCVICCAYTLWVEL